MRGTVRSIAAAIVWLACALPATAHAAPPRIVEGADTAIWSGTPDRGPVIHRATGVTFPEEIEGLKRFRVAAVNSGDDVIVNYRRGETTFTVFLYKPGALLEHRLAGAIMAVGARSPQAFVWSDGPFDVAAPQPLRLFKGTYKTGIGADTVMDYLYFGALGAWTVKVRATLPSPKDVADERRLDAAVRALPWAAIEQANGACTGAACRADRVMPFNHHMAETMLVQLLKAPPTREPATAPLLTAREGDDEWSVQPLDQRLANLFSGGFGALSTAAPLYTLSLQAKGKELAVVRFFSGTPDAALFEQTVKTLESTPEDSPFITPMQAARYAPE